MSDKPPATGDIAPAATTFPNVPFLARAVCTCLGISASAVFAYQGR